MAIKSQDKKKHWICTFCDFSADAVKKPNFCIECGEQDSFEQVNDSAVAAEIRKLEPK